MDAQYTPELSQVILAPIVAQNATDHPEWELDAHIADIVSRGYTLMQAYSVSRGISAAILRNKQRAAATVHTPLEFDDDANAWTCSCARVYADDVYGEWCPDNPAAPAWATRGLPE